MNVRGEKLTLKRMAGFLKKFLYENKTMNIYELEIDKIQAKFPPMAHESISQIEESDLKSLMREKRPFHLETMKKRLMNEELCFIAKNKDDVIGYIWVRKKSLFFSEVYYEMTIGDDGVWVYDELTFEEWRGRGIQQQILSEVFKYHGNLGYKRVYVGILSKNEPSTKAHAKFGFNKLIKVIKLVKIFGMKRHKVIDYGNE